MEICSLLDEGQQLRSTTIWFCSQGGFISSSPLPDERTAVKDGEYQREKEREREELSRKTIHMACTSTTTMAIPLDSI